MDLCEEQFLAPVQGRAHDPIGPARRGRLDPFDQTAPQQLLPAYVRVAFGLRDLLGQPPGQGVGIGDGALAEPQRPPDLTAVELDGAPRPLVEPKLAAWSTGSRRPRDDPELGHQAEGVREVDLLDQEPVADRVDRHAGELGPAARWRGSRRGPRRGWP